LGAFYLRGVIIEKDNYDFPFSYNPKVALAFGSLEEAVFILKYYRVGGWISKTLYQISLETGLNSFEILRTVNSLQARKLLKQKGKAIIFPDDCLQELCFQLDWDKIDKIIDKYLSNRRG